MPLVLQQPFPQVEALQGRQAPPPQPLAQDDVAEV